MIKGRYIGTIEYDFEMDVEKVGNTTMSEAIANMLAVDWDEYIFDLLKPTMEDHNEGIDATVKVTQQYYDVYEMKERE